MATTIADMLMFFKNGTTAIAGEGQSAVDPTDAFTSDFEDGKFIEIEDFDFGIDVVDSDSSATSTKDAGKTDTSKTKEKTGRFSKWIQGIGASTGQGAAGALYPVEMEPFSLTKQLDIASPVLFQNCFQTKPFDSAVLVRRKVGGQQSPAAEKLGITNVPYLRIEFKSVLIVAVDWDGSDIVKEKVKFVCRTVSVKYRPQMAHGKAGATIGGQELSLVKAANGGSGG